MGVSPLPLPHADLFTQKTTDATCTDVSGGNAGFGCGTALPVHLCAGKTTMIFTIWEAKQRSLRSSTETADRNNGPLRQAGFFAENFEAFVEEAWIHSCPKTKMLICACSFPSSHHLMSELLIAPRIDSLSYRGRSLACSRSNSSFGFVSMK